ncbi:ABC transporter ATP-binding protein [Pseudalkalibacillus hwajinpoensis]|uniref:ABC transporter ATP-binding protein n=1 Tax=Guptibacillus hwajinpoensis TaxID=208199 RepID=A0A4U1MJJ0_9BACL|nr:ABC transporter ATP-binding protein [Pseudalkalibacillus hwajinpoensis]TKD70570.1 ABC transporter ATP-binding protein [Pseudalkalibacillus hwajinpoensis]
MLNVEIEEAGYEKNSKTIRDLSFKVKSGELLGLLGSNGAGKSTTIKTILGLVKEWKGSVTLEGNARYAYIPEQPVFYDSLTLWEHLELAAAAVSFQDGEWEGRAKDLIRYFKLDHVEHDLPSSYSKGMRQKVILITAFMLKPDLYIIDEPFLGLDPRATKDFLKLIEKERARGAGVLMSTHVLDTAERICDRFVLISSGEMAGEGTLGELRERSGVEKGSLLDCVDSLLEQSI